MKNTALNIVARRDLAAELSQWIKLSVLPFWSENGRNPDSKLFHEHLRADGTADTSCSTRMRVQFRQIYVFAHAASQGWFEPGAELALESWRKLLSLNEQGTNGFAHSLSADGCVIDARRDSYDHAFALLAASWLYKATGDASVGRDIANLLAFVDKHLTDEHGALREGNPDSLPRRANPQMHWFEAMLSLMETGGHESAADRADSFRTLFEQRLYDSETGTSGEYFTDSWSAAPGNKGALIEPGHMCEWSWLLRRHEALAGLQNSTIPTRLLASARKYQQPGNGLLVDECLKDGTITRQTRRGWLQTELVKACLTEAEIGIAGARNAALEALDRLNHYYLGKPFDAGWIDQLDADANPLPGPVPASILYHVFVAISECDRVLLSRPMIFDKAVAVA